MRVHVSFAAKRALSYIVFSVLVLGLMLVLGILPTRENLSSQQQEKARLRAEIERQEVFQPVYAEIMQRRQDPEPPDVSKEHHRDLEDAPGVEVMADTLESMAADSGLGQISFSPVPQSLENDSGLLLVNGRMQGSLHDFRKFLLGLAGTSAFKGVEEVEIRGTESLPKYSLRLWVSLKE